MNHYKVKFSSHRFETHQELKTGLDVVFEGEGAIEKTSHTDQHDGTEEIIATIRPTLVKIKEVRNGIIIDKELLKKNTSTSMSLSQEQRFIDKLIHEAKALEMPFEDYYKAEMRKSINRKKAELDIIRN